MFSLSPPACPAVNECLPVTFIVHLKTCSHVHITGSEIGEACLTVGLRCSVLRRRR